MERMKRNEEEEYKRKLRMKAGEEIYNGGTNERLKTNVWKEERWKICSGNPFMKSELNYTITI